VLVLGNLHKRDPALGEGLPGRLSHDGHRIYVRDLNDDASEVILADGIHLAVADRDGLSLSEATSLCYSLRQESAVMLLLVGAFASPAEREQLLDAGADACLTKPLDDGELAASARALLRRHPLCLVDRKSGVVRVTERLSLDLARRLLIVNEGGREVPLTEHEFKFLAYLIRHEGVTLSREALLSAVWGQGYEGSTREVDVYVRYLRRKLEPDPARPRHLLTRWGQGYQFASSAPSRLGLVGKLQHSSRGGQTRGHPIRSVGRS